MCDMTFQITGRDNKALHALHVVPGHRKKIWRSERSLYTPPTHVKRVCHVTQMLSSYFHSQEARAPKVNT